MSDVTNTIGSILLVAAPKVRAVVDGALEDAKAIGGEAGKQAALASTVLANALQDAAAGRIDVDVAQEVARRGMAALEAIAAGAAEAGQQKAAARAAQALGIAKDVGLALLKAGISAAAAAL